MAETFPRGKTAIVVIHGIGEQNPFETLDAFSRGVIKHLTSQQSNFTLHHELATRTEGVGPGWTESYLRLQSTSSPSDYLDIHEFYWAYLTEEKISVRDVYRWITMTLDASRKFYREDAELQQRLGRRLGKRPLPLFWLKALVLFINGLQFWGEILRAVLNYIIPFASVGLGSLGRWISTKTRLAIIGYIGDVAIYTSVDRKSKYYQLRTKILQGAQSLLKSIVNDPGYDQVIIAGHSLGSVIAYDTLSKINLKLNVDSRYQFRPQIITHLITFGSPLDKIAFFFREHADKDAYIHRQIIGQLYSFRSQSGKYMQMVDTAKGERKVDSLLHDFLSNLKWFNYYHNQDPISGYLDYYVDVANYKLTFPGTWGLAHNGYWNDNEFYQRVFDQCFRNG